MLFQTTQWQQLAEQYELIIADFLRAQAVAHSAKTNYQYLLLEFYADPRPLPSRSSNIQLAR
jgi:hypothetical protein